MARRVLVTGASGFLGRDLVRSLETEKGVEYIAAVDTKPIGGFDKAELIRADIASPLIQRVIASTGVDTVVHADLTSSPLSVGGRSAQKERNVIGTMQLLGACQRVEAVEKVVVRSSTAVYGNDSSDPSILREDWSNLSEASGYSKDLADAETFARDFGRRRSRVKLTILRFANVMGPTAETSMTQLFSLPLIPTALGFDPRLQLLHEHDAVRVLRKSVVEDHPGVFNVAADGVLYLSQAIRLARRLPLPVVTPLGTIAGDVLRRFGVIDFPTDQTALLVHGRVVDTQRLKEVFGYEPVYTTRDALVSFLESPRASRSSALKDWQKELYEFAAARFAALAGGPPAPRPYVVGAGEDAGSSSQPPAEAQ